MRWRASSQVPGRALRPGGLNDYVQTKAEWQEGILNRSTGVLRLTSRRSVLRVTVSGVLALVLVTAAAVAAQGTVPPPRPAAQGEFAGLVDIGGRRLYLECQGTGSPTVVLLSGYSNHGGVWSHLAPEV